MKKKPEPVDEAFNANHALSGVELQPWTPARVVAAQSMGMLYPNIGTAGVERFRKTRTYPGALRDAIIVLWLCTVDVATVREADRTPEEAYDKATKWATEKGITNIKSDAFWDGFGKFMEIVSEVETSTAIPKPSDNEDPDDPND